MIALTGAALAALAALAFSAAPSSADAPVKMLLDTDIGDDVDDAYALALAAVSPRVQLLGVTTARGATDQRAQIAAKLLHAAGRPEVPVMAGIPSDKGCGPQRAWADDYRSRSIRSGDAIEFLWRAIRRSPGEVTLVAIGPLTNLGALFQRHPEAARLLRRLVIMGGAAYVGYNSQPPPVPEWNIVCDPAAARIVFASGARVEMAGLDVTAMLKYDKTYRQKTCAIGTPLTDALAALTQLWGNPDPTLFDPMAVAWAMGARFCEAEERRIEVGDDGMTRIVEGAPNALVLVRPRAREFLDWYLASLSAAGK